MSSNDPINGDHLKGTPFEIKCAFRRKETKQKKVRRMHFLMLHCGMRLHLQTSGALLFLSCRGGLNNFYTKPFIYK